MEHSDWTNSTHKCKKCDWSGTGADASIGESFRDGADYHCPKCDYRFGFVAYPTFGFDPETVARRKELEKRISEQELKSASQLPEIEPGPTALIWDVIDDQTVILHGDNEIWREASLFEDARRFSQVSTILREKYGETLRELELTTRFYDQFDMLEEDIGLFYQIKRVQKEIAQGKKPPT